MIKLPEKIKVAGMIYDIIFPYTFESSANGNMVGIHCPCSLEIKISDVSNYGIVRHDVKIVETLVHEVLHAIDSWYLSSFIDEENISLLAYGIMDAIKQNKEFIPQSKIPKFFHIGGVKYRIIPNYCFTDSAEEHNMAIEYDLLEIRIVNGVEYNSDYRKFLCLLGYIHAIIEWYQIDFLSGNQFRDRFAMLLVMGIKQVFEENSLEHLVRKTLVGNAKG